MNSKLSTCLAHLSASASCSLRRCCQLLLLLTILLSCQLSSADEIIRRLPAIDTTTAAILQDLPLSPLDLPPPLEPPYDPADVQYDFFPENKIRSHKEGFFQKIVLSGTWLAGGSAADIGITELKTFATFALPLPTPDHPLLITPGFGVHWFDGPLSPELPGQVYSAYVQFMWIPRISQRWRAILAINPGVYSDFEDGDNDPWRLLGRGVALYDWIPDQLQLLLGVYYLDRDDVNLLPVGGLIWTPSDEWKLELVFPQPKIAHRLGYSEVKEDWVYLAGEFGGDSWAIQRSAGATDRVTMRDVRLLLGYEQKRDGGSSLKAEIGYVFYRRFEYASATADINQDDTFLLRLVGTY